MSYPDNADSSNNSPPATPSTQQADERAGRILEAFEESLLILQAERLRPAAQQAETPQAPATGTSGDD